MSASRKRETKETSIEVILNTEGAGIIQVDTGIELLDEILSAIARGAGFDLTVKARGDLETGDHHTTEDTAITLGSTLAQVIKSGIGSSMVPSGQSVATAAVRFGEPGYQGNFVCSPRPWAACAWRTSATSCAPWPTTAGSIWPFPQREATIGARLRP